jgi:hypothetical protein
MRLSHKGIDFLPELLFLMIWAFWKISNTNYWRIR